MNYVIKPGDNLWSIAGRFGVTIQALAAANHIADPQNHMLYIGQTIYIPTSSPSAAPGAPAYPSPENGAAAERLTKLEREFDQLVTILDDHRRQIAELGRRIQKLEQASS
jgi:LysM repeat protein